MNHYTDKKRAAYELEQLLDLAALAKKHRAICEHWKAGAPVEIFRRDGCYCIRYESGAWWHYDVSAKTWF